MSFQTWKKIAYVALKLIFCVALVAGITILAWHFNKPTIMWWYLAAIIAYLAV